MLLIPPKPLAVFPALFWESNNCANEAEMDQSGSCQIIEQPNVNTVRKHPCFSFWLQKTIESKQEGMILWYIMNVPILPVSWVRLGCWVGFPPGKGATPPCGHATDCWTQWRGCSLCCKRGNEETPCHVRRGGSKAAIMLDKLPQIKMKLEAFINMGGSHRSTSSRTAGHDGHDGHAIFFSKLGHSGLFLGQSLGFKLLQTAAYPTTRRIDEGNKVLQKLKSQRLWPTKISIGRHWSLSKTRTCH